MKVMAFGKNWSGELLFKPVEEQQIAHTLAVAQPPKILQALADNTPRDASITSIKAKITRRVIDLGDPRQAGWTFLVAKNDPQLEETMEVIQPLAIHRGMEDPSTPLVFSGEQPEEWFTWVQENYYAREFEGKGIPRYILMAGGPRLLPFRLQSILQTTASVGRLEFDTLDELKQYVEKLIRIETALDPVVTREVILFAPDEGMQDVTYFSREYMVKPLIQDISQQFNFQTTPLMGADATKTRLVNSLKGAKPALIYTASHGLCLTGEPLDRQKRYNGAICCQPAGELPLQNLFCCDDVPMDEPFLEGSVFFQFACFGYGTPAQSDYSNWLEGTAGIPEKYADIDFIASLPKRLLAHPRGPISYVGHLDTAFMHAFIDPNDPSNSESWHARMVPFKYALEHLLGVQPSALAMESMNSRASIYFAKLASIKDRLKRGELTWTPETERSLVDTWIIACDACNYMIFGDPAARLRLPTD